ncbi:MAG TPA: hypothetical protein VF902_00100 [Coriobacteriia bacterium]
MERGRRATSPRPRSSRGLGAIASRHEYVTATCGYALILVLFLAPFFFQGRIFAAADFHINFAPWDNNLSATAAPVNLIRSDDGVSEYPRKVKFYAAVQQDGIPFWDSYKLAGYPFYEGISQTMVFTPLFIWLTVIPPAIFTGLYAFARLLLAGIATYVFCRTLKISPAGAFLAGLVFMLSGPLVVWLTSVLVDFAFAFPALLACVEGFLTDGRKRWLIAVPPIVAWVIMLGYPPGLVHVALVVAAYAAARMWQTRGEGERRVWVKLAFLLGAVGLGAGVGAVGIHTMLTFMRMSPHSVRETASYRLPLESALMLVYPNVYGVQASSTWALRMPTLTAWNGPSNYCEAMPYVGLLPLILAPVAVWRKRRVPVVRLLGLMAALMLLTVYSNPLPINTLLAATPILKAVTQTRLLIPLAALLAVLAGFGLDELIRRGEPRPGSLRRTAVIFAVGIAVFGAVSVAAAEVASRVTPQQWEGSVPQAAYQSAFDALQSRERIIVAVLGIALAMMLWLIVRGRLRSRAATAALIAFALIDALLFGAGFNPQLDPSQVLPTTPSIDRLKHLAKGYRVAPVGNRWVLGGGDLASAYGIESIGGYDMRAFSPLTSMLQKVDPKAVPGTSSIGTTLHDNAKLPSPVLDALSVRYLVADPNESTAMENLKKSGYRLVFSTDMAVFENPKAMPRAWSVPTVVGSDMRRGQLTLLQRPGWDPRATASSSTEFAGSYSPARVSMSSWKQGDVTLSVDATGTAFVVLSEMAIPQWTARIDGVAAPVATTDFGLLGVRVPSGSHSVRFRYESPGFARWSWISGFFVLLWAAASLAWTRMGSQRRRIGTGGPRPTLRPRLALPLPRMRHGRREHGARRSAERSAARRERGGGSTGL